jgi:hypothetical protein
MHTTAKRSNNPQALPQPAPSQHKRPTRIRHGAMGGSHDGNKGSGTDNPGRQQHRSERHNQQNKQHQRHQKQQQKFGKPVTPPPSAKVETTAKTQYAESRESTQSAVRNTPRRPVLPIKESIQQWSIEIINIKQSLNEMPELPLVWEESSLEPQTFRVSLLNQIGDIWSQVQSRVDDGSLMPRAKHSGVVMIILENLLYLLSEVQSDTMATGTIGKSGLLAVDLSGDILSFMKEHHVNIQESHYQYCILTACRAGEWKQAASLYQQHIDPDQAGSTPSNVSVTHPVGLYALARAALSAQEAVQSVMDAVRDLCMISSTHQDQCKC